jgi:hypothetical protein
VSRPDNIERNFIHVVWDLEELITIVDMVKMLTVRIYCRININLEYGGNAGGMTSMSSAGS